MNCKPLEEAGPGQEKVNFSLSSLRVRRWRRSSWVHFSIQLEPVVSPTQRFCLSLANKIYCGLALVKIGRTRTEPKLCYRRLLVKEINMQECGDSRSTSSGYALTAIALQFIDKNFSLFAAGTLFFHICCFSHESTR